MVWTNVMLKWAGKLRAIYYSEDLCAIRKHFSDNRDSKYEYLPEHVVTTEVDGKSLEAIQSVR